MATTETASVFGVHTFPNPIGIMGFPVLTEPALQSNSGSTCLSSSFDEIYRLCRFQTDDFVPLQLTTTWSSPLAPKRILTSKKRQNNSYRSECNCRNSEWSAEAQSSQSNESLHRIVVSSRNGSLREPVRTATPTSTKVEPRRKNSDSVLWLKNRTNSSPLEIPFGTTDGIDGQSGGHTANQKHASEDGKATPGLQEAKESIEHSNKDGDTNRNQIQVDYNNNEAKLYSCEQLSNETEQTHSTDFTTPISDKKQLVDQTSETKKSRSSLSRRTLCRSQSAEVRKVKFADTCGKPLAHTRLFEALIETPDPEQVSEATRKLFSPMKKMRKFSPLFHLTSSNDMLQQTVVEKKVKLESLNIFGTMLTGTVLASNLYDTEDDDTLSEVVVRYSTDDWKSWDEFQAPFSSKYDCSCVRYSFEFYFEPTDLKQEAVAFCIRYRTGPTDDGKSVEFWDNNSGSNYSLRLE